MDKLVKYILIAVSTALIGFIVWFFGDIVLYVLVSAILSLLGKPLVDALSKVKIKGKFIPKWLSATITLFSLFGLISLILWAIIPLIYDQIYALTTMSSTDFMQYINVPMSELNRFLSENRITALIIENNSTLTSNIYNKISPFLNITMKGVGSIIDHIVTLFIAIFSISFITFFFLKDDKLFKKIALFLFPAKYEDHASKAIDKSIGLLSSYFIGLLIESALKIVVISLGLYMIGIDFSTAVLVAVISGILNVIPYIGPIIGAVIGVLLALTSTNIVAGEISNIVLEMIILFGVFQLIDNIILQPYIYSSSVKAHPLEIFILILAAGSMAGVFGMLLAIPAYTVLRVFAKAFFQKISVVQKLTDKI